MKFYYCDACHYCFEEDALPSRNNIPNRCPDCGAKTYDNKPAVRPAKKNEIDELLRLRAEDKENNNLPSDENKCGKIHREKTKDVMA